MTKSRILKKLRKANSRLSAVSLNNMSATTAGTATIYEKYNTSWHLNSNGNDSPLGITKPIKTGFIFDGYWTEQNGTGTKVINANGTWVSGTTKTFNANGTLYAYWVAERLAYSLINNGKEYEVTGIGTVTSTSIIIPLTYNGKAVTSIGDSAFRNSGISNITLPKMLNSI